MASAPTTAFRRARAEDPRPRGDALLLAPLLLIAVAVVAIVVAAVVLELT
jgi:hypothetical protein